MFWKKNKCPITEDDRIYVEESTDWLFETLDIDHSMRTEINPMNFGFNPDGGRDNVYSILKYVAQIYCIDQSNIEIEFYVNRMQQDFGDGLITQIEAEEELPLGKYVEYTSGQVAIQIEENEVNNFDSLVATISHELAHYKLLYVMDMQEIDEELTDLLTVIFGLGVFGANTSITNLVTWSDGSVSGWQVKGGAGYLHFKVWGYALAYWSYVGEQTNPSWLSYLHKDVKRIYEASIKYLVNR